MLEASTRLGPYEIVAPLGAGGMGEVYRARDTRLGREVAIKVLPEAFASSPDRQARFEREARAVAALSHPNILAIHDYGTQDGVTFAVMELLEGETLRSRSAKGPLPWREAVEIGAAIADGLAAAHAKGIIHRDLKPENLFLTADGRVKILDFGLARIDPPPGSEVETDPYLPAATSPGVVMGTAGYMSPEQVRGQPVDARSDLFSFGCVLYEAVTGVRAFQRDTGAETMTAILHDEPPDLSGSGRPVPAELGRIIRQCLAKNPNQRLHSARDLALGLRASASDPHLHRVPPARPFARRLVAASAAALLIGAIAASVYFLNKNQNPSGVPAPSAGAKAIESVAVLPFENQGGDPKTEPFSEGIPETVIHRLSRMRLPDLKVRSLLSVSHYKGRKPDLEEIRRELRVGAVVTGRVQQPGDRLVVSVAITDARDGSEIWSAEYEWKLDDIVALQDRIAKDIAAHLHLRLTGEEEGRLAKRDTENSEAYQLYLKGRYFWNKRTPEGLEKAIQHFQKAIGADPNYALAWAGLADVYLVSIANAEKRPSDTLPKAKAAANRALEFDNQLAEAYTTLAAVGDHEWNWSESEALFKTAIKLKPEYASAHQWYAILLTKLRRFDEAREQDRQAQEADPLSLIVSATAARNCFLAGRYDAAIEQCRKTLEMDRDFGPAHTFLAEALLSKDGKYEEALGELQARETLWGESSRVLAQRGRAYALMGRRVDALKIIDRLKALSRDRYIPPSQLALIYASLRENKLALDWLEEALDQQDLLLSFINVEPAYEELRSDPRFVQLLRRIRLADKAAGPDQAIRSVAVLPFVNKDPKTEFLSDGVADHIIHSLSRVGRKDLKVRPFSSVARYKGKELDTQAVGRELKVQMIVTGTLRPQGDDLTISVSLVDVREENELWGHTYPPAKRDKIQDLQDRIARDVAAELHLQLTGEEEQRLTKRYTKNSEAYLLYCEGVFHWSKFRPNDILTAIEYYQRALKIDPNYALAYAGLGRCYLLLGAMHVGSLQNYAKAREYLTKALSIDSSLEFAHSGLGLIAMFRDWDWPEAERELSEGLALDSTAPAENHYGFYLAAMGRPTDALVYIRRAQEANPSAQRRSELAMCYNWLGQYDQAIVEARKALELDPNFPVAYAELGTALVQQGKYEEAIAEMQKALDRGQNHPLVIGIRGCSYAKAGNKAEAHKVLEDLKGRSKGAFAIARIHAALGEKDQAFEWLRKSCAERDSRVIWIKVDPTLESLHKEPEFAKVLKEMNLPP
jgi:serine/threonine-protein kinase